MIWIKIYFLVSLAIKNDGEENKQNHKKGHSNQEYICMKGYINLV